MCGSAFQSYGAAEANDLWPYVQDLTSRGGSSRSNVEDRRLREGVNHIIIDFCLDKWTSGRAF